MSPYLFQTVSHIMSPLPSKPSKASRLARKAKIVLRYHRSSLISILSLSYSGSTLTARHTVGDPYTFLE